MTVWANDGGKKMAWTARGRYSRVPALSREDIAVAYPASTNLAVASSSMQEVPRSSGRHPATFTFARRNSTSKASHTSKAVKRRTMIHLHKSKSLPIPESAEYFAERDEGQRAL